MRSLVSLGANLGSPRENILTACQRLAESFGRTSIKASHLYRTPAIGGPKDQGEFLNAVVAIDGPFDSFEVWHRLRDIEQSLGRERLVRWEARRIDLDILLTEEIRIWTPRLKVPHPRMCTRSFILEPAMEVAPEWIDPVSQWTIRALAMECKKPLCRIQVIAENASLLSRLREELQVEIESSATIFKIESTSVSLPGMQVRFDFSMTIDPIANECDSIQTSRYLVGAVESPDPESVAWEDFARPWAEKFGLSDSSSDRSTMHWIGPRYLLSADQPRWAAHELLSMAKAIRCPVERMESISIEEGR